MKVVIQRVKKARVTVEDKTVAEINQGLLLLIGLEDIDENNIPKLTEKILNLRIFENEKEKFDRSVKEIRGEILLVPQFTLLADCSKGNRPFFGTAAGPIIAKPLFEKLVEEFKKSGLKIEKGVFGAKMEVDLKNDGPVTIILEK